MAANGWARAERWAERANTIAPTLVGGSLLREGEPVARSTASDAEHDPVHRVLRDSGKYLSARRIAKLIGRRAMR